MNDFPDPIEADASARPEQLPASDEATAAADEAMARLQRERDEYHDRYLRLGAEFDNYRKRIERERREASERATASAISDLLPIVDDFERALQAESGAGAGAYRDGIELIHRQLLDLLARRGVTPIDALGADFDPHLHQAVAYEPSPGRRDGEIVEELARGYTLGDRLLRPAMVKVARA